MNALSPSCPTGAGNSVQPWGSTPSACPSLPWPFSGQDKVSSEVSAGLDPIHSAHCQEEPTLFFSMSVGCGGSAQGGEGATKGITSQLGVLNFGDTTLSLCSGCKIFLGSLGFSLKYKL